MQPNTEIITQEQGAALTIIVPGAESLPPSLLANIEEGFRDSFAQAEKWRLQALAIKVTSPDQKAEMKLARTIRLELKDIRVNAEKKRKALKEDSLRLGKAIDGVNNLLLAAIEPLERHLEEQEKFAERLIAEQRAKLQAERSQALAPYLAPGQIVPALDAMTEEQWSGYLSDAKLLHEAKIERERREEAERIAREQAEAAERERLRIENERLQREAAEREAAAKAEREAAAKAQREAEEKARKEREALEAAAKAEREAAAKAQREAEEKARKEREALEAAAKAEREAAAKAQREAEEKARKEREALEAAAKAEREAAERELARIKAEAEAAAAKERAERERLERELAEQKAAEEAKIKAEAAARRKAAAAPDKAKLRNIASIVRAIYLPEVTTEEGAAVLAEITAKIESFAKWIETQTERL